MVKKRHLNYQEVKLLTISVHCQHHSIWLLNMMMTRDLRIPVLIDQVTKALEDRLINKHRDQTILQTKVADQKERNIKIKFIDQK